MPLYMVWYASHGIPLFTRCTGCSKRLFDVQYLRSGMCGECQHEMALSQPGEFYQGESEISCDFDPAEEHIYRKVVNNMGHGTALDVGCGLGRLLLRLHSRGNLSALYGIDMSQGAVSLAKMLVPEANICAGDVKNMPFSSDTFDYVICTEVLEHIDGDGVIQECYRVLKPGGVALITVPNGSGASGKYFPYHIRLFSLSSIVNALKAAGFEIILAHKFGLYIPVLTCLAESISVALRRNLPLAPKLNVRVPEFLATHFFIKCQKPLNPPS